MEQDRNTPELVKPDEEKGDNRLPTTQYETAPPSGTAGASAKLEFERRHNKREAELDRRFGRMSGLVKFLSDDPQSTKAWAKGSKGEQMLAETLAKRLTNDAVLLNDRKIPRSRANIDHLAIAPSGIWVIDAKYYKGQLKRVDKGGWFKTDQRVYVNGRDQTKLIQGLHLQASVVRNSLGDTDVPIHSTLCFLHAEWDFFLKPFQIDGVWVTYGKHLAEMIGKPGPLSKDEVLHLANSLATALPSVETPS